VVDPAALAGREKLDTPEAVVLARYTGFISPTPKEVAFRLKVEFPVAFSKGLKI
jgi:hypothetical protein